MPSILNVIDIIMCVPCCHYPWQQSQRRVHPMTPACSFRQKLSFLPNCRCYLAELRCRITPSNWVGQWFIEACSDVPEYIVITTQAITNSDIFYSVSSNYGCWQLIYKSNYFIESIWLIKYNLQYTRLSFLINVHTLLSLCISIFSAVRAGHHGVHFKHFTH